MNLKDKNILITGASFGIGQSFTEELAKIGANLFIVARTESKLKEMKISLEKKYKIKVNYIAIDLTLSESPEKIYKYIKEKGIEIDVLINNAGFGKWGQFHIEKMKTYEEMINLNITSLVSLTYLFIPDMLKKGEGGVINVASTGAFQPVPYIAVYCATKAFVLNFSEALYGEYSNKGLSILALCPGNTESQFQTVANANTKNMRIDSPQRVVKEAIKSFLKKDSYKINGIDNYFVSNLVRFLPRKLVINIVKKMMIPRIDFS